MRRGETQKGTSTANREGGLMEVETRPRQGRTTVGHGDESVVAELIDRLEAHANELDHLREQIASLRDERERLKWELSLAQAWVKELAGQLEEARANDRAGSLRARLGAAT
jgi:chromosome segregation ATPase